MNINDESTDIAVITLLSKVFSELGHSGQLLERDQL